MINNSLPKRKSRSPSVSACFLPSTTANQFRIQSNKGNQMGQNVPLNNLHTQIWHQTIESRSLCMTPVSSKAHILQIYFSNHSLQACSHQSFGKSPSQTSLHKALSLPQPKSAFPFVPNNSFLQLAVPVRMKTDPAYLFVRLRYVPSGALHY